MKKNRTDIPRDTAAQVQFLSDRTCCICRIPERTTQIHHLDEDPSNNHLENLALLCLECHDKTMIQGGFGRKLDAEQVKLYRDDWHKTVAAKRALPLSERKPRSTNADLNQIQKTLNEIDAIQSSMCHAGNSGNTRSRETLSEPELAILSECAQRGELYKLGTDAHGSWVRAGMRDFFNSTDPAVQARYLEAFESLCIRGLIRHEEGILYRLTGTGFEAARQIARS